VKCTILPRCCGASLEARPAERGRDACGGRGARGQVGPAAEERVETVTTPPRAGITEERATTYTYDPVTGNVASISGPGGVTTNYTYDAQGRLRTVTDSDSFTRTYDYDALGRQTKITYADWTYEETAYERLDPTGRRDRLGRWTHTFYDALRRVVSTRDPAGRTVTQQWCSCGSLDKLVDAKGNATTWERDLQGRMTREVRANSSAREFTYETTTSRLERVKDPKLQEIHHKQPSGATLNKFNYTYDALGNIQTWAQQTDMNPAQTYTFEYDRVDQLTAATLAAATPKRYRYAYDPAGNRTVEQVDDAATAASYDNMNRLSGQVPGGPLAFRGTVSEPGAVTVAGKPAVVNENNEFSGTAQVPSGTSQVTIQATDAAGNVRTNVYEVAQVGVTRTLTYDPNGNLTGNGTNSYDWDAENRLIAVKQGGNTVVSFTYDGNGRRNSKAAGGVITSYVYDGAQYLEERSSAEVTKRYVYSPGIDRPLAQIVGGVISYFVADHLGSVVRTTDAGGAPTLTREYDPWGNLLQGLTTKGYAFTGREWDSESGLYYYRARYFDPRLGRFLSDDPVGFKAGTNLAAYVKNNPLRFADPSGSCDWRTFRPKTRNMRPSQRLIEYAINYLSPVLALEIRRPSC